MAKIIKRYNSELYGNYRRAYCISGIITGVVMGVVYWMQSMMVQLSGVETLWVDVVLAIAIFYEAYRYRANLPEGKITQKELLLLGVGQGAVSAIFYGLFLLLLLYIVRPELLFTLIDSIITALKTTNPDNLDEQIELYSSFTPVNFALMGAFRMFVLSILFAFFSAVIFRTEKAKVR